MILVAYSAAHPQHAGIDAQTRLPVLGVRFRTRTRLTSIPALGENMWLHDFNFRVGARPCAEVYVVLRVRTSPTRYGPWTFILQNTRFLALIHHWPMGSLAWFDPSTRGYRHTISHWMRINSRGQFTASHASKLQVIDVYTE